MNDVRCCALSLTSMVTEALDEDGSNDEAVIEPETECRNCGKHHKCDHASKHIIGAPSAKR